MKLADCHAQLNDKEKQLMSALRTLTYDIPRPEVRCRIGYSFMEQHENLTAIHWYNQALIYQTDHATSFQNASFSTWLPHLQLCVLHDRLQQHDKAFYHNECARKFKPTDSKIMTNKAYLDKILQHDQDGGEQLVKGNG